MKNTTRTWYAGPCFPPMNENFFTYPNNNSYFWLDTLLMNDSCKFRDDADDYDDSMDEERCPHCDQIVSPEAERCNHCGKPLNMSLYQRVG